MLGYYIEYGGYWYPLEQAILVVGFFGAALYGAVYCLVVIGNALSDAFTPPPAKTAADFDQDAVWFRAQSRMLEAQNDYKMKKAESEDIDKFLSSRPKVGSFNAKRH